MKAEESKGRANLMALREHVLAEIKKDREQFVKRFNMGTWIDGKKKAKSVPSPVNHLNYVQVGGECGTSGCLFGHAVNVPVLREQGLCALQFKNGKDGLFLSAAFLAILDKEGHLIITDHNIDKMIERLFGIDAFLIGNIFYYTGDDLPLSQRTTARNRYSGSLASLITPEEAIANLDRWVAVIDEQEAWTH